MNIFRKYILLICLALTGQVSAEPQHQVHYIGFNFFHQQNLPQNLQIFDDYVSKLQPIMAKHGLTLRVFDVSYGGSDALPADIISFGSAPDMQAMQAFFQDPQFHVVFPQLLSVIKEHQVVFMDGSLLPEGAAAGPTLLALNWLKTADDYDTLTQLGSQLQAVQQQFGVRKSAEAKGIMANKGLADAVIDTTPPSILQVWHLQDAHGYFDNATFTRINKQSRQYLARVEDFWITVRKVP